MKKIILLGLQTDTNLGDGLLAKCTEKLVTMLCDELEIKDADIIPADMRGLDYRALIEKDLADREAAAQTFKARFHSSISHSALYNFALKLTLGEKKYLARKERKRNEKAAREAAAEKKRLAYLEKSAEEAALRLIDKDTAAVIFVGGGLIKYGSKQDLPALMKPYILRADELCVPVMFNAVGIEGFDGENEECLMLRELMNKPCVKCITTRDDIELLRSSFILRDDIVTKKVPDPACRTAEFFPQEHKKSGVIGIGVARGGLFTDHGGKNGEKELLDIWAQIISELEKRGLKWKIFSNGILSDLHFGEKLLEHIGRAEEKDALILPQPRKVEQFVSDVNSFDGIIACRLHASIIAYSFKIPAVEIVWNIKQRIFGDWIGVPERFLDERTLDPALLVERLVTALDEPYPENDMNPTDTYDMLKDFFIKTK